MIEHGRIFQHLINIFIQSRFAFDIFAKYIHSLLNNAQLIQNKIGQIIVIRLSEQKGSAISYRSLVQNLGNRQKLKRPITIV